MDRCIGNISVKWRERHRARWAERRHVLDVERQRLPPPAPRRAAASSERQLNLWSTQQ